MSRFRLRDVLWLALAIGLLMAPQLVAQNPTGTLIGTVTDADGGSLPGVTVTATSPSLLGERQTQTGTNGAYKLAFLAAGEYQVTYELEGFATATRTVKMSAAQTKPSDITMQLAEVVEEIVVSDRIETISETNQVASTYTQDEVEKLPIARNITQSTLLAPGVHGTGPGGNITISGAMSFENLWLINGVVVNENVRGQSLPLFIEDAVQENTVQTGGVSAEYGRFTGGVINVLTKSGGNQLSGSLRESFDNEDWESENAPLEDQEPNEDKTNDTLEVTLGGPFWKDRIWFFSAYRDRETTGLDETTITDIAYSFSDAEERLEGKLTFAVTSSHTLTGSYIEIDRLRANAGFGGDLTLDTLHDRTDPQDIKSANYTGILTPNFFLEAQVSERFFEIATGFGGPAPVGEGPASLVPGTTIRSSTFNNPRGWYNNSLFCGDCQPEERNNENALIKGSYFLTTGNAGTHDFVVGYDSFADQRFAVNHQSGSDFALWDTQTLVNESTGEVFPQVLPFTGTTWVLWFAPFNEDLAQHTNWETNSFYVNDRWQLNDKWSFNLGLRYDDNDGANSSGFVVADDAKLSPRFGLSYDTKGDGDLVINASYGTYVAQVAGTGNTADASSNAGAIGLLLSVYGGPPINADVGCVLRGDCVTSAQALQTVFEWYFAEIAAAGGGPALPDVDRDSLEVIPNVISLDIPGATTIVPDTVKSPSGDELTVGVTKRLGGKGLFRADVIYREWEDFYSNKTNAETLASTDPPGQVVTSAGLADVEFVGNFGDNVLQRDYLGVNLQGRYRLTDKLTIAGNYTWSELDGNINGETGGSGPVTSDPNQYPEFFDPAWSFPVGKLAADQTHKFRAWAIYDILRNDRHALNVSVLQNFFSGSPYGLADGINSQPFVNNAPAYATPPPTVTYFFTARDAFTLDDVTRTDLSFNYSFRWNAFGKSMEVFLQPEVLNLFNEDTIDGLNTQTFTAVDAQCVQTIGANAGQPCAAFNPFTETPVEGVHWIRGPSFGEAQDEGDYQAPRVWRFSVGFRF